MGSPQRLTTPLVRVAGKLAPASWDAALDLIARRLQEIMAKRGPDGVAVFGGGGLTNEKAYLLGKFARVALRTSQVDYNGRFCMSSAAAASMRAFGLDRGLPFALTDLDDAGSVGRSPRRCLPGPYPLRHRGPVGGHIPEQIDVVARAQGLVLLNGPAAVVSGLSIQLVRAAAGGIVVGHRLEDHHILSAAGSTDADE